MQLPCVLAIDAFGVRVAVGVADETRGVGFLRGVAPRSTPLLGAARGRNICGPSTTQRTRMINRRAERLPIPRGGGRLHARQSCVRERGTGEGWWAEKPARQPDSFREPRRLAVAYGEVMTPEELADLAHLRRARDLMDRDYAQPLDVPAMARIALMSPAHFSRRFRAAYGETPYSYLMTRRIERAKSLLRQGMSVTD